MHQLDQRLLELHIYFLAMSFVDVHGTHKDLDQYDLILINQGLVNIGRTADFRHQTVD